MKSLNQLVLLLMCAAFFACGTENGKEEATAEETENIQTAVPAEAETPVDAISYQESLKAGGMKFNISTTGMGSMRNLTVVAERDEQPSTRIDEAIEGSVTNTAVTDLNQNKKPEVLVFVDSGGSGSYGQLYGYEFEREYWGQLKLPELSPALQKDYMGHDKFEVVGNRLVRTFPVYLDTDPNCCPTGGKHTIVYTLDNALNLQVEKVD
ncbi:hypothetical protein ACSX1A_18735 [Pontibacter sp. MBLB2868]|uniref:hypothetical protein n=1 Tax=Pontibacter sp. MBLB2868 TaxID=3451555 RepID=UPI003F74BD8D